MSFLIENIIEDVKDRSFVPISQSTFEDPDILRILNVELKLKLVADLIKEREDFFLYRKTVPIVGNKTLYPIPNRAIGNAFKALFFVDAGGTTSPPLTRKDIDELSKFDDVTGEPRHFYFEGDQVGPWPYPSTSGGSLLFSYPRKPNELILTESCAKITGVSSLAGTTTFTVDTDLSAGLNVGDEVDFLNGKSPFLLWNDEVEITAITATTIEVATVDVDDVDGSVIPAANDYICPTGYSNIPMIPEEFHPVLAQMAAVRMLASLGDNTKWQVAKAELAEMRAEAQKLVKNRAENAPKRITKKSPLLQAFRKGW